MKIFVAAIAVCFVVSNGGISPAQQNWPQFRGVGAAGVSAGNLPTEWDVESGKNIAWKTPIEGLGHSAPIVWGDSVFLTTAISTAAEKPTLETGWLGGTGKAAKDSGQWEWKVICVDLKSGKPRWDRSVARGEPGIKRHLKATHANCTPATDGKNVVAFFGSEGLYCFDFAGNLKWKKDFGRLHSGPYNAKELEWGFASSPVIHDGKVVVQCDCLNTKFVAMIDIETGKEIRRIQRDDVATWSTPTIIEVDGKAQIICNGYKQMAAYDFESGEQLWMLSGGGDVPVPTPLFHEGTIFITNGHARSPIFAIEPGAKGDITPDKNNVELPDGLAWFQPRGGSYMPTPILVKDLLYTCNDNGVLEVRQSKTGEQVYKKRVTAGSNTFSASAVGTPQHLYFCSESGKVVVIGTGDEYELVAENDMKSVVMATPAISGDRLLIRTVDHLVCIAKED